MNEVVLVGLTGLVGGVILALVFTWIRSKQSQGQLESAKQGASRIIEEAKKDAAVIRKEAEIQAKDSVLRGKADFERHAGSCRARRSG